MGLLAGGVMGIKFKDSKDCVVGMVIVRPRSDLLIVSSDGKAKRTPLTEYPTQGRYGQGVIAARLVGSDTTAAGACVVQSNDPVVLITAKGGAKTIRAKNAPRTGRTTLGQELIALRSGDTVVATFVPVIPPSDDS